MKLVKIWNSEKITNLTGKLVETHNQLLQLEAETGLSYSSLILTEDAEETIESIYNETDCDLCFYSVEVEPPIKL